MTRHINMILDRIMHLLSDSYRKLSYKFINYTYFCPHKLLFDFPYKYHVWLLFFSEYSGTTISQSTLLPEPFWPSCMLSVGWCCYIALDKISDTVSVLKWSVQWQPPLPLLHICIGQTRVLLFPGSLYRSSTCWVVAIIFSLGSHREYSVL